MLPTVLSQQVVESVKAYLQAAFPMNTPLFDGSGADNKSAMEQFLATPENLVKGPYLSVQLPFRQSDVPLDFFDNLRLPFPPYAHQAIAYSRLRAAQPQSTLVATGTGSGKTECFLYPILNHCASTKARGVKAIIIYPMNALATNQAERFAETVERNQDLKGKVSVGLFVGSKEETPRQTMGPTQVITCKDTLRQNPPDILLTNYKMLDYLMLRPEDRTLWQDNEPGTLRYLVVDELHTFDGAQGADLGCLIRRLKHRLDVQHDSFACVGTSATVGDDHSELLQYASRIFDEQISSDAIIREDRYPAAEYLGASLVHYHGSPAQEQFSLLNPESFDNEVEYLNQQITLWFGELDLRLPADIDSKEGIETRAKLGEALMQHAFFHNVLKLMDNKVRAQHELNASFYSALSLADDQMELLFQSFVALVSIARRFADETDDMRDKRIAEGRSKPVLPFLQVRVQSWLRELRRMVGTVSKVPQLTFADDIKTADETRYLPVVHCRDCAATGWGAFVKGSDPQLEEDLDTFYRLFFRGHHSIILAYPVNEEFQLAGDSTGVIQRLCSACLNTVGDNQSSCRCGNKELIRIFRPSMVKDSLKGGKRFDNRCPHCHAEKGLSVIGARAATLSSVATHQIFGSRFNENKKLITFSDSVQDAAHRAGFFEARTWPMMVRSTIAGVLTQGEGKTLSEYAQQVCQEANDAAASTAEFIARFIAPSMTWLQDYQQMLADGGALRKGSDLPQLVKRRLSWEVFSEFGLRCGVGRTLERTGMATLGVNSDALQQALTTAHSQLRNELGADFQHVSREQLAWLAVGLLRRARTNGAIGHDGLTDFIADKGKTFRFNRLLAMPNWGSSSRTPKFLTFDKIKAFDSLLAGKKSRSWHQQWLAKTLATGDSALLSAHEAEILTTVIKQLCKHNILTSFIVEDSDVWGLSADALYLSSKVKKLKCTHCTESLSVTESDFQLWQGSPCTSTRCTGELVEQPHEVTANWEKAQGYRVVAKEHTGLLERPVREATEQSFYRGENAWDVNLLSATPTLEMGIDVGDLSSVLLCSVPPAQANYLQRVGRAGRKDGNAYNLTVAQGNPHDQYFYQEPLTMMQGHVEAPGVFLDAPAILERQLTAFFMDNWVNTGIDKSAISKDVGQMLNAIEKGSQQGFPHNFIEFIETNCDTLFSRFVRVFDDLSASSIKSLENFAKGTDSNYSLTAKLVEALRLQADDRKSLKDRAKKIKYQYDKLVASPAKDKNTDEQLLELQRERNASLALIRKINEQETLNFLTDQGLLPNYAFPEAGVTLRSVLWRRGEKIAEGEKPTYVNSAYEYERPAATALSELAPNNHFYAGGHKVEIEQVDLKVSELEDWRLCGNCNHSENLQITGDPNKVCPQCGDPTWGDFNQKARMLKLRQVYARASVKDSKIDDASDNRTPAFFQRQMLVAYEPTAVEKAYQIDNPELPFGFEYLSRATFTDMNFGQISEDVPAFRVAGETRNRTGFEICSDCGMVQKRGEDPKHDLGCRYRAQPEKATIEQCLFLYRQLESEAIRILLPVSTMLDDDVTKASLGAALQMGLKAYFHGNVDHLRGLIYQQPEAQDEARRTYLVIYDSVPGGTGALKELMIEPHKLLEMLQRALAILNDCECNNDPDKDGCYRCVYAYRDRGRMANISRDTAKRVIDGILQYRDTLKPINSVNTIAINSMVASELERKFVQRLSEDNNKVTIQKGRVRGQAGWILSNESGDTKWHMVPQVDFGESDGVYRPSRPDFVIYPASDASRLKPIAVFLDGYEFHRDIVDDDVAKRRSIIQSGNFLVWTLAWSDLVNEGSLDTQDLLTVGRQPITKIYDLFIPRKSRDLDAVHQNTNSYGLLLALLAAPEKAITDYQMAVVAASIEWLNMKHSNTPAQLQKFEFEMRENASSERFEQLFESGDVFFGGLLDTLGTSQRLVEVASVMSKTALMKLAKEDVTVDARYKRLCELVMLHVSFDDSDVHNAAFKQILNGFWKLVNLAQLLPQFSFVTRKSLLNGEIGDATVQAKSAASNNTLSPELDELIEFELIDRETAEAIEQSNLTVPESGYELPGELGEAIAFADWAWQEQKIAVFEDDSEDRRLFEQQGWQVFTAALDKELVEQLQQVME